jgi:translation initiation factor 2 alpha subunit (eIF-2alpha)
LAELGGEDPILDQTITKLLDYATERHRKDLEDLAAKLRAFEEQFGMTSDLFSQKFQGGELGDDEAFFRWHALLAMQRRVAQRLALLLADSAT